MPTGHKTTKEEFIRRAREVHGDKYDYSKVEYKNNKTPVCIICPIHGEFWQSPQDHLKGHDCRDCAYEKHKTLIWGVGKNDLLNVSRTDSYRTWFRMLQRCYSPQWIDKYPTYGECSICDEWRTFSNFKRWFEDPANGYRKGYNLDKDILKRDNKVYSPETCCFVPNGINKIILTNKQKRGNTLIGTSKQRGKYNVNMAIKNIGGYKHIGTYDTEIEAFNAYKSARESYIKEVATSYYNEGKITKRVYDALMNWKIMITD